MTELEFARTDIIILGSGLAGLRAAHSALNKDPSLDMTLVSAQPGPSGSSFTNQNRKLGVQVCKTFKDCERFVEEAVGIAEPGVIDPELVTLLAEESQPRFQDLLDLGVKFLATPSGEVELHPGCFSPDHKRAAIMTDLGQAFECLSQPLQPHVRFIPGWTIRDILVADQSSSPRAVGALLQHRDRPELFQALGATSVICALGGPAPLFKWHQAGRGNPGYGLALLDRAGCELVNTGYLQVMWADRSTRRFWSFGRLKGSECRLVGREGLSLKVEEDALPLVDDRVTHCPAAFGLRDAELDQMLLSSLNRQGFVRITEASGEPVELIPMAHAGNGGARIDRNSETSVKGLFACGESASGMHGANRIGGAMVAATQVFGHRAGESAVRRCRKNSLQPFEDLKEIVSLPDPVSPCKRYLNNGLTVAMQKGLLSQDQEDLDLVLEQLGTTGEPLDPLNHPHARALSVIFQARLQAIVQSANKH
jgi:L-aspartate oxidase